MVSMPRSFDSSDMHAGHGIDFPGGRLIDDINQIPGNIQITYTIRAHTFNQFAYTFEFNPVVV